MADPERAEVQAAARTIGKEIVVAKATGERDFDAAFATLVQGRVGAVIVPAEPLFLLRREQLIKLAARHALPAIYDLREFTAAGGLLSYGLSLTDSCAPTTPALDPNLPSPTCARCDAAIPCDERWELIAMLAANVLVPQVISISAGIHAWTAGAIGTMTLAIMTRASLGHTGHLRPSVLLSLALRLRPNLAGAYDEHHRLSNCSNSNWAVLVGAGVVC